MRILIDIGHPAHVHMFKNIVFDMQTRGHVFFFTVREGENETVLLDKYGFNYQKVGCKRKGTVNKLLGIFIFSWRILKIAIKFKPDIFLSHGSMYAGYASLFLRKPHIALEDTGNMEQIRFSLPVSNVVLSPDVLPVNLGKKQIRYRGYHELMYLTPKYFSPDPSVFSYLGLPEKTPYAILRFISWEASHDIGESGFSLEYKRKLIGMLSDRLKVFISGERQLPEEFESFRINIPFEKMHDVLAFATIYVGEGATMASEAGILGTPSIYANSGKRSYHEDHEKFGTVFNFTSQNGVFEKINEILSDPDIKEKHALLSKKLIDNKIDVTAFFIWFIENYPQSFKIMKENPEYQERFR